LGGKKFFAAFLAGFTDAEGSIFISEGQATYSLGNYNYQLLNQIYTQLGKFGIKLKPSRQGTRKG
jgi:intein-encoded DNA endonuclease-like protein